MKCEFEFCIYNKNFKCAANEPEINSLGMCDTCIIVSCDKDFLEKEKRRQLLEAENRWAEEMQHPVKSKNPYRIV